MDRDGILKQLQHLSGELEKAQTQVGELIEAVSGGDEEDAGTISLLDFLMELEKPGPLRDAWLNDPFPVINDARLVWADKQMLRNAVTAVAARLHLEGSSPLNIPYVVTWQKPPPPGPGGGGD